MACKRMLWTLAVFSSLGFIVSIFYLLGAKIANLGKVFNNALFPIMIILLLLYHRKSGVVSYKEVIKKMVGATLVVALKTKNPRHKPRTS
jgi:hypothetical protein